MSELRLERVNEEMKKALGEIPQAREVKDPRLKGMCTVVRARDQRLRARQGLRELLGGEEEAKEAMRALGQAGGFIARQAARRVRLRRTPGSNSYGTIP